MLLLYYKIKESVKMGEKKNIVLIIIVVILLLICIGMGTFIFINKDKLISKETLEVEKS